MSEQRLDPDFITQAAQRLISMEDVKELVGEDSLSAAEAEEMYEEKVAGASPEVRAAIEARAAEIRAEVEAADARRREELASRREATPPPIPVSDEVLEATLEGVKDPAERAVLDDMLGRHRNTRSRDISPVVQEMVSGVVSPEPELERDPGEPYYPEYASDHGAFGGGTHILDRSKNPFESSRSASKPPNKPKREQGDQQ